MKILWPSYCGLLMLRQLLLEIFFFCEFHTHWIISNHSGIPATELIEQNIAVPSAVWFLDRSVLQTQIGGDVDLVICSSSNRSVLQPFSVVSLLPLSL